MAEMQTIPPPPPGYKILPPPDADNPEIAIPAGVDSKGQPLAAIQKPQASVRADSSPVGTSASTAKVGDVIDIGAGQPLYVNGHDSTGRPSLAPIPPPPSGYSINKKSAPPLTSSTIPAGHAAMTDSSGQLQAVPFADRAGKLQQGWKLGPPEQQHYGGGDYGSPQPNAPPKPPAMNPNAGWFERHGLVPSSNAVPPPLKPGEQAGPTMDVQDTGDLVMQGLMAGREAMAQKGGDIGASLAKKALIPSDNPNDPETVALRKKSPPIFTPPPKPISFDTPLTRGVIGGTGRFIGSTVADPATAAFGALSEAGPAVKGLASLGFAGMMGKDAVDAAGQLGEIWNRDDIPQEQKYEAATQIVLATLAAGSAGSHGVREGLSPDSPIFANIPDADKATLAQRVNIAAKKAGTGVSSIASRAGDVAAEVGNTDMRDNLTPEATIRKSLPQTPVNAIRLALPDIRAVADDAGLKSVTTADLLNSQPDKNSGTISPGLISEAKKAVIAEAGQAAGPGKTIADLPPEQVQPYIQRLDALDTLHDHIQQAQDKETADLKDAANTPNLPQSRLQGLVRLGRGMGKAAIITAAGPAVGRVSRALMHVYGIPSTFNDVVTGIKAIVGQGGKISPRLDENINSALGRSPTSSAVTDYGTPGDSREPYSQYQGDTSVQHQFSTVPPETPHGEAPLVRDVPNRFQVSSGTTNPAPAGRRVAPMTGRVPVGADNGVGSFTSVPEGVTPQLEPRQRSLMDVLSGRQPEPATHIYDPSTEKINPIRNAPAQGEYTPRAQHPEEIVQNAMMKLSLPALRELARAGDVDYGSADTHQDLIGKLMELYAGHEDQLEAVAETLQGQRGEVKPGARQPAPPDQTDYSDIMQQSIDAANARKGQAQARSQGPSAQPRGFMDIMRGGTDRRTNLDTRAKVEAMNPTDRAKAVYESRLTGLPNMRAFEDFSPALAKSHPHVGYADIDNFKGVNDALGHDGADEVIREIGSLFRQAMEEEGDAIHVFHRSGDEFLFRASDPEAISRVVDRVNEALAKTKFTFEDANGKEVTQEGVGLSHGTGSTTKTAELAAEASKELRTREGKRKPGARDKFQVHSVDEQAPSGTQAKGDNVSQRQSVPPSGVSTSEATQPKSLLGFLSGDNSPAQPTQPVRGLAPASNFRPGDVGYVDPKEVKLAPQTYQYKLNTNERGVTNQFADNKYNEDLAGVVHTFRDPQTGDLFAVNGHHRTDLAQRSDASRMLIHVLDVATPEEARAVGALQNIAEGQGTPTDAAKFFRDSGLTPADLKKMGVSLSASKVEAGLALSKLDPSIFHKVATGQMSEGRGVAIGSATDDPAQQEAIMSLITRAENRGKTVTDATVAELARQVKNAGMNTSTNDDLFGSVPRVSSLAVEKAEVSAYIKKQLGQEKRVFGAVAKEGTAQTLGRVKGQQIVASENAAISQQAAQGLEVYDKLTSRKGPIDTILEKSARRLADGENAAKVKQDAYEAIRQEISKTVPGK